MAEGSGRDQSPIDVGGEEEICAFCSTGPECEPLPPQAETEHHDGLAAVVQCEKVWKEREILNVYFMNPLVLDSWGIGVTTQQILYWANEAWRKDLNSKIPEFKLCEVLNRADIRVKFAEMKGTKSEGCWSMVGMYASKCGSKKPTMVLDLTDEFIVVKQDKIRYKRSLVIHQFGHALGLEHEHQRSELWRVLEKYIDKKIMNDSRGVSTRKSKKGASTFGMDWTEKKFTDKYTLSQDYDPLSIMHYGFDMDWFKDKRLRRPRSLEESDIPEKHKVIIRGLQKRRLLAEDPSVTDLKYLEDAYKRSP